jgi:hypothetical protein
MRPDVERTIVSALDYVGLNASRIARITGIPRSTVRDWLRPNPQGKRRRARTIDIHTLPEREYSYLLGFYLGDGALSRHARDVYRLRIITDVRYPGIIEECAAAMQTVMPQNRVRVGRLPSRAVEIGCYSKAWPMLFPQHGPGRKHERRIALEPWQQAIVGRHPREFLRGLIHSDGSRVLNRVNGKPYPRYFFSQVSDDIRRLFCEACRMVGVEYTWNRWNSVSIARAPSVAILDSFIGPKA